jgi:hypothetical protein
MSTELDVKRILVSRNAAVFLGASAALSVLALVLRYWNIDSARLTTGQLEALSWSGAAAAFGMASLLFGMWVFWVKCDTSSKATRRVWFFILLIGMPAGALPYYFVVYLPCIKRRLMDSQRGHNS